MSAERETTPERIGSGPLDMMGRRIRVLRALPDRFPMARPGGVTWGHSKGEMARLAALVEGAAHGG